MMGRSVIDEHFVPEAGISLEDYLQRGEKTAVHHLIRYQWAEAVIAQLGLKGPVLDVACGAGYGSYGIAMRFPALEVVGGDYDAEAISFARARYRSSNLSFAELDVTRWNDFLAHRQFGCVISFDTIEHIEHREIMMQNIVEHLRPDGVLLLSTPVRSQNVLSPGWEHHKIEFSRQALFDFLRRYFAEVMVPDFGTLPCMEVFDRVNETETVYLLRLNPVLCRKAIRISFEASDSFARP